MCRIIDTGEDEEELNKILVAAFSLWKSIRCFWLDEKDLGGEDWVQEFCEDVPRQMKELERRGRLSCGSGLRPYNSAVDAD
jgi:hypothetical protein